MTKLDDLRRMLAAGRIGRREFMAATSAVGLGAAGTLWLPRELRAQAPNKGGRLRAALAGGSTTDPLDPAHYADTYMLSVGFATHSTLMEIAPDGTLTGDAVESWEASDDARIWYFTLRPDVTYSNGRKMVAEDVVASINHHRGEDSESAAKSITDMIEQIKADGPRTVVVTLKSGNADFPFMMCDYHLLIAPADEGKVDWQAYIGSGGYTLEEHEPGVRTFLKRRPDYWKENRAHVDEVEILSINDTNARQNALTTGEVDVITRADLKTAHLLGRRPGLRIEEVTGFLHYTTPMITTEDPFTDNHLRMALKLGIDREAMLQTILRGHGSIGNDNPISPIMPYYAELEQRQYDPEKARWHLKQADMEGIRLDLSASDAAHVGAVDAAQLIQEHVSKAGIEVNIIREPSDGYWSNVWMKKPWCMCYWGGRPTPDWMYQTAYARDSNWNDTFWDHDRFNELLLQARTELDQNLRAEIYREMQQLVRDEGGVIVWAFANYVYGIADRVEHGPEQASNWELDGGRAFERWWLT